VALPQRAEGRGRPADWIAEAVSHHGADHVVDWCLELLEGTARAGDQDWPSLDLLGGPGATRYVVDRAAAGEADHWSRVWGARALRYVWRDAPEVELALVRALEDTAWRVREHAAALVALREIGAAADALVPLLGDETPRVRVAAARGLAVVGEHEHLGDLERVAATDDAPGTAARTAIDVLRRRLDLEA